MLERFLEAYDAVLVLDTETTGISCRKDEIIELAVLKAGQADGALGRMKRGSASWRQWTSLSGSPKGADFRTRLSS